MKDVAVTSKGTKPRKRTSHSTGKLSSSKKNPPPLLLAAGSGIVRSTHYTRVSVRIASTRKGNERGEEEDLQLQ